MQQQRKRRDLCNSRERKETYATVKREKRLMQQQKKSKDLCDNKRKRRIKMYTEYSENKMNKKEKMRLIKKYEKIMFTENLMRKFLFFTFNIMNTYTLN